MPMGAYEPEVSHLLAQLLTETRWGCADKDVWDVGAYIGMIALLCAKHARGRVVSFELSEKNIEQFKLRLSENPSLGGRVEIVPGAIADVDGETEVIVSRAPSEHQIVSRAVKVSERNLTGEEQRGVTQTMRLD